MRRGRSSPASACAAATPTVAQPRGGPDASSTTDSGQRADGSSPRRCFRAWAVVRRMSRGRGRCQGLFAVAAPLCLQVARRSIPARSRIALAGIGHILPPCSGSEREVRGKRRQRRHSPKHNGRRHDGKGTNASCAVMSNAKRTKIGRGPRRGGVTARTAEGRAAPSGMLRAPRVRRRAWRALGMMHADAGAADAGAVGSHFQDFAIPRSPCPLRRGRGAMNPQCAQCGGASLRRGQSPRCFCDCGVQPPAPQNRRRRRRALRLARLASALGARRSALGARRFWRRPQARSEANHGRLRGQGPLMLP